jgi:hypothetical protein
MFYLNKNKKNILGNNILWNIFDVYGKRYLLSECRGIRTPVVYHIGIDLQSIATPPIVALHSNKKEYYMNSNYFS